MQTQSCREASWQHHFLHPTAHPLGALLLLEACPEHDLAACTGRPGRGFGGGPRGTQARSGRWGTPQGDEGSGQGQAKDLRGPRG